MVRIITIIKISSRLMVMTYSMTYRLLVAIIIRTITEVMVMVISIVIKYRIIVGTSRSTVRILELEFCYY